MHDESATLSGFDAVAQALKQETFPMDMPGLYYAVGELPICVPGERPVPVRELLDRIPTGHFDSPEEAVAALHEVARNVLPSTAADSMLSSADAGF